MLSLIALASDDGTHELCTGQVMDMILLHFSSLPDGSKCIELAIKLLQLLVKKIRANNLSVKKLQDMTNVMILLAKLFAANHAAALEMLTILQPPQESRGASEGGTYESEMCCKSLAPGFRFYPTDQELISYYLKRKITGKNIAQAIAEREPLVQVMTMNGFSFVPGIRSTIKDPNPTAAHRLDIGSPAVKIK